MIQFFKWVVFAFLLLFGKLTFSQEIQNPYTLYFGINAIDSRTSVGNSNYWMSNHFNDFFNVRDNWNYFSYSFDARLSRYISKSFIVGASASINLIDKYVAVNNIGGIQTTNPGDLLYYAFDGSISYSFMPLIGSKHLEPSLIIGGGYTVLGDNDFPTFNLGGSITYWFSKYTGFELSTRYKKSFGTRDISDMPNAPSLFQHSAGLIFKFGRNDMDADGVDDKLDSCPQIKGLVQFNGCPDSDSDGVADKDDVCPDVAGLTFFKGCPDSDGDGVSDNIDVCPNDFGLLYLKGCPDGDGDGVADVDDSCPEIKGLFILKGCPDTRSEIVEHQFKVFQDLMLNNLKTNLIHFKTNSAKIISINAEAYLDLLASYIKEFDQVHFIIEGHTDNVGTDSFNEKLSVDRAETIRFELLNRGVKPENLSIIGYGNSRPIVPNTTEAGRAHNRRCAIVVQP